tara:strand:+ start:7983 stop:8237 length:255 start_codon:yes stop_codon:yes gene_type:complete
MKLARQIFEKHWTKETSYSDNWDSSNASIGQCAISALNFQDIFEGEICKKKVRNKAFSLVSKFVLNGKNRASISPTFNVPTIGK